jgi:DNA polymerase-3 subunit epsilon
MREIVLDTETTGLDHKRGDRIVEIGCVELLNGAPTGNYYQTYINPLRDISPQATAVSGITTDFVKSFPVFDKIVDDFLNFVGQSVLVIHNAGFDIGFLNSELARLGRPLFDMENVIDTIRIARRLFPGSPASLDALCKRFDISLSKRDKHGALLDAQLLAKVYIQLKGGRQRKIFSFGAGSNTNEDANPAGNQDDLIVFHHVYHQVFAKRHFDMIQSERDEHQQFMDQYISKNI